MLAGDGARPADGRADAEAMNKESPAREPCVRRNRLLLKGSHAIIIKGLRFCGHGRKLLFMVEITLPLAAMVENQYITTTRVENEYYWSKIDVYYSLRSKITQAGYPWTLLANRGFRLDDTSHGNEHIFSKHGWQHHNPRIITILNLDQWTAYQ